MQNSKKISLLTLSMLLALQSLPVNAQSRNRARSNTQRQASRSINSGLVSGYNQKIFKNPTVTVIEKRSIKLSPLMHVGENGIELITKKLDGNGNTVDTYYKLCLPCNDIFLEASFTDGTFKSYTGGNAVPGNCYSLEPGATYTIATKEGAINTCGSKLRMTINDMRSVAQTEVDSVILNVLPNSSAYDYTNIELGQDTNMDDLINNYNKLKNNANIACTYLNVVERDGAMEANGTDKILDGLNKLKEAIVASTISSGIASGTGVADTTLQSVAKVKGTMNGTETEDATTTETVVVEPTTTTTEGETTTTTTEEAQRKLTGSEIASVTLSTVSAAGNLSSAISSFVSVSRFDALIKAIERCKNAANKMHIAGVELENALQEMTVLDNVSSTETEDNTTTN